MADRRPKCLPGQRRRPSRWGLGRHWPRAVLTHGWALSHDRAHIIDWAWPTRGAAWIDPAILILRLLEAGHTLVEADAFACRFPSWRTAPAEAKEAFASANAAAWKEIAHADSAPWKAAMAGHAIAFTTHLHTLPGNR
ncbi:hypothetical protein ACFWR9_28105 [Streptomyces sp. NPDC058534]|uniref:hypothetical protein n=1 Tax=Streptomyces sp. NPDC058534 TaxID=3346541 RepID=UPI00364F14B8